MHHSSAGARFSGYHPLTAIMGPPALLLPEQIFPGHPKLLRTRPTRFLSNYLQAAWSSHRFSCSRGPALFGQTAPDARSRPARGPASTQRAATCPRCPRADCKPSSLCRPAEWAVSSGHSQYQSRVCVGAAQSLVSACPSGLENSPLKSTSKLQHLHFYFHQKI